jgi:glycosyltransferase EpsF
MSRALVVMGSLRVGGLEKVAVNCVKFCADKNMFFDFLIFDREEGELEREVKEMGCRIYRAKYSRNPVAFCADILTFIRNYGPYDIVHSHIFFYSGVVMLASKKCGVKCRISHSHSIKRSGDSLCRRILYQPVLRMLLNRYSTKYCACSYAAGEYLFGQKKFQKQGVIIPNVIEMDKYAFHIEERRRIRKEFGINENTKVLGFIGHLTEIKNPHFFINLSVEFMKDEDVMFLVIGDGPQKGELENRVTKMGLENRVIFTGLRNDIGALLSSMDLYICPSKSEGFGIVLLEALANGLCFIAEKNAIVKEIADLGHSEFINGFDNIEQWILTIKKMLNRGRDYVSCLELEKSIYNSKKMPDIIKELYS